VPIEEEEDKYAAHSSGEGYTIRETVVLII
jgi:hypothetical protein